MNQYRVRWVIDIDANTHHEAAEKALAIQRKHDSIATVFEVQEEMILKGKRVFGRTRKVDFNPETM